MQHTDMWAIESDTFMDGADVSCLVTNAFLQYVDLHFGILDYWHIAMFFGRAIKQDYYKNFPIDKIMKYVNGTTTWHYAICRDRRSMNGEKMYTYHKVTEACH